MKKHTSKKVRVSRQTRTARGSGISECPGDPRQCSTLYCPDCVPGRYCGKGKPTPKVASAAVGVRGAAPHTAEVPPATVADEARSLAHTPAVTGISVVQYLTGAWRNMVPANARPTDALDSISRCPPRPVQLQPEDLKLGGMVDVAVVPPASPDGQAVERLAAWRAHAAELYRLQPGLSLGIADDDFDDLLGSDEALDAVREQLIAQAWGLA